MRTGLPVTTRVSYHVAVTDTSRTGRRLIASRMAPCMMPVSGRVGTGSPGHAARQSVARLRVAIAIASSRPATTMISATSELRPSESIVACCSAILRRPTGALSTAKRPPESVRVGIVEPAVTHAPASGRPETLSNTVPTIRAALESTRCARSDPLTVAAHRTHVIVHRGMPPPKQ
jgi:hypothetical protein